MIIAANIALWIAIVTGIAVMLGLGCLAWLWCLDSIAKTHKLNRAFAEFLLDRRDKRDAAMRRNCVPRKEQGR